MTDKEVTSMAKTLIKLSDEDITNLERLVIGAKWKFAADLKERINIKSMSPGIATPSPIIELKEVFKLIDETLNAK